MGYVDNHLLTGESVVYRAHRHWSIFFWPVVILVASAVLFFVFPDQLIIGLIAFGVGLLSLIPPIVKYQTSEFAVTNKRLIVKIGLIQRSGNETLLSKIENIAVDQTIAGRMFGYGTLTVTGTGGTVEHFPSISAPMEFRRQVQAQIVALEERRGGYPDAAAALGEGRQERECPYCAERILARAKVCRFCGREVVPTVPSA